MTCLPNALIIGVQKASTSWLSARLDQHPDVYVVPGEVHYFDREFNFARGLGWYAKRFKNSGSANVRLEKSGAYIWTTCVDVPGEPKDKPERIAAAVPDARLIVVLRDPVARAYSAWNHMVRAGRVRERGSAPDLFASEIAEDVRTHGILTRGLYYAQLARYLEVFSRDQILVLIQERDVVANPSSGLRKVCHFLNIDADVRFTALKQPDNRFEGTCLGNRMTVALPKPLHPIFHRLDRYVLSHLPIKRLPYPVGDTETRAKLADYYEQDCRKLADLIGPLPNTWLDGRLTA